MAELQVVVPPPVGEKYILTLSKEEAEAILALVGQTTGSDYHSRRKYTSRIYDVLSKYLVCDSTDLVYDRIFFKNREDML